MTDQTINNKLQQLHHELQQILSNVRRQFFEDINLYADRWERKYAKNVETESSFVTLETVVDRAVSPQGPFSRFSGAFDRVAQLSRNCR